MAKEFNKELFQSLDHIRKEANSRNNHDIYLTDVPSPPSDDDLTSRVSKLIETVRLPNECIDFNALVYDLHGILSPHGAKTDSKNKNQ